MPDRAQRVTVTASGVRRSTDAHHVYGCAFLIAADVCFSDLDRCLDEGAWEEGPLPLRSGRPAQVKNTREIRPDQERQRILGPDISRLTHNVTGAPNRFHLPIEFELAGERGKPIRIIGMDLICADDKTIARRSRNATDVDGDHVVPAVLIVHFIPAQCGDDDAQTQSFPLFTADRLWSVKHLAMGDKRFDLVECLQSVLDQESSAAIGRPVRIIGTSASSRTSQIPLYSVLTDVEGDNAGGDALASAQRLSLLDTGGGPRGACEGDYATSRTCTQNWSISFSDFGVGFFCSDPDHDGRARAFRKVISDAWVDLLALEILQFSIIEWFADRAAMHAEEYGRRMSHDEESERNGRIGANMRALWAQFIAFQARYAIAESSSKYAHSQVLRGFESQFEDRITRLHRRTRDNLEHLERLAKIEADELEAERQSRIAEAERREAQAEREFNEVVGLIATVLLPATISLDVLSWFSWPWWVKALLFAGVVLAGLVLGPRSLRRLVARRASRRS